MRWADKLTIFGILSVTLTGAYASQKTAPVEKIETQQPAQQLDYSKNVNFVSALGDACKVTPKKTASRKARATQKKKVSGNSRQSRARRVQPLTSRSAIGLERPALDELALNEILTSPKGILVEKAARRLTIYENGQAVKSYLTTIGRNEFGSKVKRGDWTTPEGLYHVLRKNPASKYYLALHINYPNRLDTERGLQTGLISQAQYQKMMAAHDQGKMPLQNTRLGSYIEIHGGSNRVVQGPEGQPRLAGWTQGCMGLRNVDVKEVYHWAPEGTPVLILP